MVKRITLLFLFFGLCVTNGFSQNKVESSTESNLYATALSACIVQELKQYGKITDSHRTFNNRIVEYDELLTGNLPTQFGEIKVEYLNANKLRERYEKTRKTLSVLSLRPAQSDGAKLRINIPHYLVTYKKRRFNFALEGGCRVYFKYDCSLEKFVLDDTELWGV